MPGPSSPRQHGRTRPDAALGAALVGAIFFGTLAAGGSTAYRTGIERALWYEIVLFLLCLALVFRLSADRDTVIGEPARPPT